MKVLNLLLAITVLGTLFFLLIVFGNIFHPILREKNSFIEEMETNALFYSESPEALHSSYELKRKLSK